MDILNSGSFVPLDNRVKIDQLIFTATTLATEVSRAEGFQSSGSANHQLGLEMWKGAEYMCRAHEEATIRNLFLSKFLERLREIERQSAVQPGPAQTQVTYPLTAPPPVQGEIQVVTTPPMQPGSISIPPAPSQEIAPDPQAQETRDEYLGVISQTPEIASERPLYADECKPKVERDFAEMNGVMDAEEIIAVAGDSKEDGKKQSMPSEAPLSDEPIVTEAVIADASEAKEGIAGKEADTADPPVSDITPKVNSIVLSEKEPYNFDSCTVTAVIQLLPESGGIRKSVISIRSHDFAPQISISDIRNEDVHEDINRCLETALGQYRSNLPILAAEKVKKQKSAGKKNSKKVDAKDKKTSAASDDDKTGGSTVPPTDQGTGADKNQQNLFAS